VLAWELAAAVVGVVVAVDQRHLEVGKLLPRRLALFQEQQPHETVGTVAWARKIRAAVVADAAIAAIVC